MKFRITTVELSANAGQMSDEAWAARLGATLLFASLATCIRDHINLMQTIFQCMIHRSFSFIKAISLSLRYHGTRVCSQEPCGSWCPQGRPMYACILYAHAILN